jgi:hypothetical protein
MRPTPFYVQVTLALAGEDVIVGLPVEHRYEGDIFSGEKRTELLVVPALSVRVSPQVAIVPASSIRSAPAGRPAATSDLAPTADREIRVTVLNDTTGPLDSLVKLELPAGWTGSPVAQPVKFARGDESQTVRFKVKPGPNTGQGEFHVRATASANGQAFSRGYAVIEYPHIKRYHIYDEADATLKVINVRTRQRRSAT